MYLRNFVLCNRSKEHFEGLLRELEQCESGFKVEKVEGDQKRNAIFTLLPPDGICESFRLTLVLFLTVLSLIVSENSTLDIVREVSFISTDGGATWRAEVRTIDTRYVPTYLHFSLWQG